MSTPKREVIAPLTGIKFFLCALVILSNMLLYRDVDPGFMMRVNWDALRPFLTVTFRVDVFFMMTGFLLMHLYKAHFAEGLTFKNIKTFLIVRVARVYPLYALVLCLILILYAFGVWQSVAYMVGGSHERVVEPWGWFYNFTLTTAWGLTEGKSAWNGPAWSISAEFFNYLMFPFYIVVISRLKDWRISLLCLVILCVFYGFMQHYFIHDYMVDHGYGALMRANFGLLSGAFVYGVYVRLKAQKSALWDKLFMLNLALVLGMMALDAYVFYLPPIMYMANLIFMVLCLSLMTGKVHHFFASPLLMHLGKISFAMYLLHQPVCRVLLYFFYDDFRMVEAGDVESVIVYILLTFAAIVAASHVAYTYVETPLRYGIRRRLGVKKAIVKI